MPTKKEIDDLERALNAQERMNSASLEALGINAGPTNSNGASGVFDLASAQAAEVARQKLRIITGTSVRGLGTQVIVEPERLRLEIDRMAQENGWPIEWYDIIHK